MRIVWQEKRAMDVMGSGCQDGCHGEWLSGRTDDWKAAVAGVVRSSRFEEMW